MPVQTSYNPQSGAAPTNFGINNPKNIQGGAPTNLPMQPKLQGTNAFVGSFTQPKIAPKVSPNQSQFDSLAADIARLTKIINSQPPTPQLPNFNSSAARATARQEAVNAVNPVYQGYLDQYMKQKSLRVGSRTADVTEAKTGIETELSQLLEDSATRRDITTEDTATQIGDINANEGSYQTQEGRQFDRARSALLGDVADAGLSESGIGQGAIQDATTDRNLASADQTRDFTNQRRDVETFKTRTFKDLDTVNTRGQEKATTNKASQDRQLEDFILMEDAQEDQFRFKNEQERFGAINSGANDAYSKVIANEIAKLAGSGRSAADIDFFSRVYGA